MIDIKKSAHRILLSGISKSTFIGVCDRVRKKPGGEEFWQAMMNSKKKISEREFLNYVDPKEILDEGEKWEDYRQSSPGIKFYESLDGVYFFQVAGFEFIWKKA